MPPIRSKDKIEDIYLLYDVAIKGVPPQSYKLLNGHPWTGKTPLPTTRGDAARLPYPGPTTVTPDFFPHTDKEIDAAVTAISHYFQTKDPRQISEDKSGELDHWFD